ncbi:putative bifunctional diguanylate cyclase/phosphodiesterase [Saccharothrix sp. ST-888]|uniref:putative bifunctional diguanylate cyclase/phosphodiesterase n=1 Tax=Saccharothrix sp. ST-888 TaxID=1427391 RepID=UPI000A9178DF|nr:EAL domain-containing protein [Saccharothrix sp. ST-888]
MPGRNEGADAHRQRVRHGELCRPAQSTTDGAEAKHQRHEAHRLPALSDEQSSTFCPTCSAPLGGSTRELLAALRASESRFRAAFADAGIGMALIDSDDRIIEANPAFAAMIGHDLADLVRTHIHDIIEPEENHRQHYLELVRGERDRLRVEKRLKHRDGRAVWSNVTISLIRDGSGYPLYTMAMVEDVTEQRLLGDRLAYQALHDPLTRLPNRTLFFERLNAAFMPGNGDAPPNPQGAAAAKPGSEEPAEPASAIGATPSAPEASVPGDSRTGLLGTAATTVPATMATAAPGPGPTAGPGSSRPTRRVGLCYVDLDGFAAINETLGHHVGDQLLVAVAARLERGFSRDQESLVARLGGDEFAVLVADSASSEQLTRLASDLIAALEQPFDIAGQQLVVTASVGVVERPVQETTPTDLLKDADATLYWSKADGRARWTLYDPDRGAHQLTRQRLATALRPALERGEFTVEYQPLVGLADGAVHGAEALVRWCHPRYGTLSPDRFIPLAEESGAIVPLGKWVLEESCRQARQWLTEFPDTETFVSVNLAARQIWDSDVVADVAQVLERTGLPPRLLQLEITESAVLGPGGRPVQALQALADMGVRIAIDDFGTGYSNLAYLSRLPVHVLKLDGSFIEGFRDPAPGGRPDNRFRRADADEQIVGAMVQLAHALGLTVTAEGIENASQAERLRLTGCDTAQGWYFAKPGEAERVAAMLRARQAR